MKKINNKAVAAVSPVEDETETIRDEKVTEPTNNEDSLTEAQKSEEERKFANWGMDGTAFIDFRFVDNIEYSHEIIDGARAVYDPDKLESLKSQTDLSAFLAEGKSQILSLCHADQALDVHTNMFKVIFQINVGNILNIVEPTFKQRRDYMTWLRDNFKDHHMRYFQQAKQLALLGNFARTYAAAGKNRLLAVEHLREVEKRRECEALFADHPLPDSAEDDDGKMLKSQIDSVITLHRLQNEGLQSVTFDQAALIASYSNEALGAKKAKEVKKWLDLQPEDQRPALFDRFIQDKLSYPSDHPYTPAPKASLDKVLSDLVNSFGTGSLQDDAWIAKQRELKILDSLLAAQSLISQLIERIGVVEPVDDTKTETQAA